MEILFDPSNQIYQILISIFLGVFVGLRREMFFQKEKTVGLMGIRTLPLITLLGTISTFFIEFQFLPILLFVGLFLFILIAYWNGVFNLKKYGLTSEILGLIMFLVGVLVGYGEIFLAVLLTIIISIFTAYKSQMHNFARKFAFQEWSGALQLIIITALILPVLPKEAIDSFGILVPYKIWILVIFISAIGFVGYFLQKYLGKQRGLLFTSAFGSIVSSTAITISLAHQSKKSDRINLFTSALILSILVMLIRIIIVVFIFASIFHFSFIAPALIMTVVALIFFLYYYFFDLKFKKEEIKIDKEEDIKNPFELLPALKFGLIFIVVLYLVYFGEYYFGEMGAYFAAGLAALVDTDAVVLSTLESFRALRMEAYLVINIIAIAIIVNTLIKIFYIFIFGRKELFKKIFIPILVISLAGFIPFFFFI